MRFLRHSKTNEDFQAVILVLMIQLPRELNHEGLASDKDDAEGAAERPGSFLAQEFSPATSLPVPTSGSVLKYQ